MGSRPFIICKWLVQKDFSIISTSFRNLFVVVVTWKRMQLLQLSLCCTEMRWMLTISTAIWVNSWDNGSVASRARSELTNSKCEWTRIWTISIVDETNLRQFHPRITGKSLKLSVQQCICNAQSQQQLLRAYCPNIYRLCF